MTVFRLPEFMHKAQDLPFTSCASFFAKDKNRVIIRYILKCHRPSVYCKRPETEVSEGARTKFWLKKDAEFYEYFKFKTKPQRPSVYCKRPEAEVSEGARTKFWPKKDAEFYEYFKFKTRPQRPSVYCERPEAEVSEGARTKFWLKRRSKYLPVLVPPV